jgi:hypothetical protein
LLLLVLLRRQRLLLLRLLARLRLPQLPWLRCSVLLQGAGQSVRVRLRHLVIC